MTIRLYNRFKENYQKTIDEIREEISDYMTFEVDDPYQQPLLDLSNELFEQLDYMEELWFCYRLLSGCLLLRVLI